MPAFDASKKSFDNLTGNPSNYTSWSENMESFLKTRREWLFALGRNPEPEYVDVDNPTRQERLDHIEWQETRDSAAGTIWLCIDDSQKDHVRKCRHDPEAMWDRLKEIHLQRKPGPRFNAYDSFFSIRKEDNESLTQLTGRVTRAMATIKSLRPLHFGLQQLDEELQCMALICALPTEYSGFVTSLFLLDKLSLSDLRNAFQNQENNTQLRDGPSSSATVALKASTPTAAALAELLCNWCHCKGHIEENCYTKKFSQTRDRKNAAANKGKPKAKGSIEKGASAETLPNEESVSLASIDPSSPASSNWNTDTGASRNMTPHRSWFKMYSPHVVPIRLADDSYIYSEGLGSVVFWPKEKDGKEMDPVEFHDVLHVPALRNNLLSPFHLTREKGYSINISDTTVNFLHGGKPRFSADITSDYESFT